MKYKLLYLLAAILLVISNTQAQDMLVFPKSNFQPNGNLSINNCMAECTKLMIDLDPKDTSNIQKLRERGQQLTYQGKHDIAAEVFKKILILNKEKYGVNHVNYANSLVDMARVYILLIRYTNAISIYKEALATLEKATGKNSMEYLSVFNELAVLHTRAYDYKKAQVLFVEGLGILKKIKNKNRLYDAIILNNIGACQKIQKEYKLALASYDKAMEMAKGHPRYIVSMGANKGEILVYLGKREAAINVLNKYSKIATKILTNKDFTYTRIWNQFALGYLTAQDFEQTEEALKNAFVTNSLTFDRVNDIANQANELMFENEFLATCSQAAIMLYSIELYKQRYLATNDVNYLKKGYPIVEAMSKFGEELMNSFVSEQNKLKLFRLGASVLFEQSIFYANELYKATGERKYIEDAFFISERSKSTLLVNTLRAKDGQNYIDLPKDVQAKQKALKSQFSTLEKKLIEAITKEDKNRIRAEINSLQFTIENFKNSLKIKYPTYYQHRYNTRIIELANLQDKLNDKQVVIEYYLGVSNSYAFVISKEKIKFIALDIDSKELKKRTKLLRKSLSDYRFFSKNPASSKDMFKKNAYYFYQTFIAKLLDKDTKSKDLIIIPDGGLGHLPFEVFLSAPSQQSDSYAELPYLLKDYSISYSYSATIFLAQNQESKERKPNKKGVLAFAAQYDDYSNIDESVRGRRGGDIADIRKGLAPLPGADKEVEMMQKNLYGTFFRGELANEQKFKEISKDYNIIHLAMHGVLDNKNPILSSLVFSADTVSEQDNFLRAYEIAQLDLNTDLVVLSACETGYGKFQQGEGIMSLAHSFTYAGASSVLMSLWQVNDFSTGVIMKNFYTNLAKGMPKNDALQAAKLLYLKNAQNDFSQHPAFWAAFVQQGDVKPLEMVAKSGFTFKQTAIVSIGMFLLVAAGFLRWNYTRKKKAA